MKRNFGLEKGDELKPISNNPLLTSDSSEDDNFEDDNEMRMGISAIKIYLFAKNI